MRQNLLALLLAAALPAFAACPSQAVIDQLAADWASMTPGGGLPKDMSMADAVCGRDLLVAHIANIDPFIELPDLVLDPKETLNGPAIAAINVGARLGVLGAAIPAQAGHIEPLAKMMVVMRDEADSGAPGGKELGTGAGAAILEHPLNAVIWIAQVGSA